MWSRAFFRRQAAVLLLAGLAIPAAAEPSARPRVGLVLGGGGARGLAHLGVLEELEKLRVPISCIAGTSAGALAGGSYATGQPLADILAKVQNANWERLLSGRPDRRVLPFPAKINDYKNLAGVTLGLDGQGVHLPRSVIGSQDIDRFLRELAGDAYLKSFAELPIPFKAVATNLVSGEIKVFDGGDLALAMRASMAVPGVFDLVELDGQFYVDGMFVRNLPVDEVKGKCADVVIAVDVGMPRLQADQIHSLLDVATQAMSIATGSNVVEQRKLLGPQDILIQPRLDGFTPASFSDAAQIIERGRRLDEATRERLSALAVDEATYAAWQSGRSTRLAAARGRYDTLEVARTRFVPPELVRAQIESPQPPETQRELLARMDALHASGDFDRIDYFLREEGGKRIASVVPVERRVGPNTLRFGTEISLDTSRKAEIALLANYQMTWLNRWGAQWRNDLRLGTETRVATEFYQPLWGTPLFAAANLQAGVRSQAVYDQEGSRLFDLRFASTEAGLDLGYALGRYGEFRLGPFVRRSDDGIETGLAAGTSVAMRDRGLRGSLVIDQLDNPRFPRRGYHLAASYRISQAGDGADVRGNQRQTTASGDLAGTFGVTTWRGSLRWVDAEGAEVGGYTQLGGFLQLSGLQTNQLLGQKSAFGRLMAYRQISPLLPSFGSGSYLGGSFELGRMFMQVNDGSASAPIPAASLWLGMDTFMGPLYLGVGWANYRGARFAGYLYLGYAP